MQSVVILSAAIGVASAATKQVLFAADGGLSTAYIFALGSLNGSQFEALKPNHIPASVFTDDCFDISPGLPFGSPAWGKFNCNATGIVDSFGMYADSNCNVKLSQPLTFAKPTIPTGANNPARLGWNFAKNTNLSKPFDSFESMTGYCLSTPLPLFVRLPFDEAACTTQQVATPVGTAITAGYAGAFPAIMPYASGKCYSVDLLGAMTGKFVKVTSAGITLYDNELPTSMILTASECTDTNFAPTGPFFSSGVCACSDAGTPNVTVSAVRCANKGAACLKSTGAPASGADVGTCAFLAGASNTTDAAVTGTAVNECGHVGGGITAGTFVPILNVCMCYADSQCKTGYFCLQENGQRATAAAPGTCGVWSKLSGSTSVQTDPIAYTGCASSAHQVVNPLNVCNAATRSIWKAASANMYAVSAASVVVAMTSLFA